MKKILNIVMSILVLFNGSFTALAVTDCAPWSIDAVNSLISAEVLLNEESIDFYSPITRINLADLISNALEKLNIEIPDNTISFTDADIDRVGAVTAFGIMNGYGDGTFLPQAFTSRQEMAKIILMYKSVINSAPLDLPDQFDSPFTDFNNLSEWAKPYVEKANKEGLISGYTDGSFCGLNTVSWQEAVVLLNRVFPFDDFKTDNEEMLCDDFNLNAEISEENINVTWNNIDSTKPHSLTIVEQRLSRYENDIPPNNPVIVELSGETSYTFNANPNKKYFVKISCDGKFSEVFIITPKLLFDDMKIISDSYPSTQDEAENFMVEITVPVWKLKDGVKIPSEATLTVHNEIAQKVTLVFQEIYSGSEQFPIKDLNAYSWRGGRTEHNGGTAIDINSNENYCIYNDGTTIGSYWKPYEDPYSITPYGDVVRAFEKYGFTWGGDAWSNPKDYMHFSYLGT